MSAGGWRDVPELRQCGPECLFPDEPHIEPIVDWIGDNPIMHGEREDGSEYCLCGHRAYLSCPHFGEWMREFELRYPDEDEGSVS